MVRRPTSSPALIRFHQHVLLAFCFAMRSCEYLWKAGKDSDRRTKPIRKRNIVFIKDHKVLPHTSPLLAEADCVSITFEFQKRDDRDETIHQGRTNHPLHCPVKVAAAIVQAMISDGLSDDDFVYTYRTASGKKANLAASACLKYLRAFISTIDNEAYGIFPHEIGLHSLRSSSAMAMYLNGVSVCTIMLMGRWSSDAFLRYIRHQVEQFGSNVSQLMISKNTTYHHSCSPQDLRSHNPHSAAANFGMGNGRSINRNVFSVWE